MAKTLDLSRTVHDLVADYPELRDVMASIGFPDIAKPMALNTVGRVMTIPQGLRHQGARPRPGQIPARGRRLHRRRRRDGRSRRDGKGRCDGRTAGRSR